MEIFEYLRRASSDTMNWAKDTAELARLNFALADGERALESLFAQLGRAYFDLHPEGVEEALRPHAEAILRQQEHLREVQGQIKILYGIAPCPECGADMDPDAEFCPACGKRRPRAEGIPYDAATEMVICPSCARLVKRGAFCTYCGQPIPKGPEE